MIEIDKTTRPVPACDLGLAEQYYIVAPGYIEQDASPEPAQLGYGIDRFVVYNLEVAPLWLFYAWLCGLARRAGVYYLFTERITEETCTDRWHAISELIQLCTAVSSSCPAHALVTSEIYSRQEALAKVKATR